MSKEKDKTPRGDALETLKQIRNGDCVFELTQKLEQVVEAVRETGKDGELTLKIKVGPISKGSGNQMGLRDAISAKIPEPDKAITVMFATNHNTLQRNDPNQMDFEDVERSFRAKSAE